MRKTCLIPKTFVPLSLQLQQPLREALHERLASLCLRLPCAAARFFICRCLVVFLWLFILLHIYIR